MWRAARPTGLSVRPTIATMTTPRNWSMGISWTTGRGSAFGHRNHHILISDQAQVSMEGVGRVEKGRWGAGAVQCCDRFAGHIRTLSDAGEDQATTALALLEDGVDRAFEVGPDAVSQCRNRLGLHAQGPQGSLAEVSTLVRR